MCLRLSVCLCVCVCLSLSLPVSPFSTVCECVLFAHNPLTFHALPPSGVYSTWADNVSMVSEAVDVPASKPESKANEWAWEDTASKTDSFEEESNMLSKGFMV